MKSRIVFLFIAVFAASTGFAQSSKEILHRSEQQMRGESSYLEMTLQIVRPSWSREMKMKSWSKGDEFGMTLITAPAKEKGTVFLKRDKEVWNWVPRIDRTIKLPPSMMSQSWMGTDFTNDDLVRQSSMVDDYEHQIAGDSVLEGRECWKLILTPKEGAPVVWGKLHLWIDKKDFLQLRSEAFDEDNYLVNIMQASEIKTIGGRLMPTKLEMIPAEEEGHKTVMIYDDAQFDQPIEEQFFSTMNMKRLR
jgi:outer membrane lipoprotein-sorting protein